MSSPLLIDEPPLQVLPSLAVAVGLNEALILQQVHYWIQAKRKAPERYQESFKQGEWWVYNSVPEWNSQFPFWGDNTIRRALSSLREAGLLIAAQLAPDPRDKTLWYRIDYDKLGETTALHHAPKGTAKKKFASNMGEIETEIGAGGQWADAPTQNGQMAALGSTQNGQVHQSKMGKSHLPKAGSSHPPKMGKTLTETSSENSQRLPQKAIPDSSASLFKKPASRFIDLVEEVLDVLPPQEYVDLEAAARERVIAESIDPVRTLVRQGGAKVDVKRMMLTMLRERDSN